MIGLADIYKVISEMCPLYVALVLGWASVKCWHMFNPDHCDAINRFNCYFVLPFYIFEFTTQNNPYEMNHLFIAADIISKAIILIAISLWANCSAKGSYRWSVTSFSLCSLNNSIVVGVPLMQAMFGDLGRNLVIQSSILQSLLWNMMLLLMLEFEHARKQLNVEDVPNDSTMDLENDQGNTGRKPSVLMLLKAAGLKLAKNPNSYACLLGLSWSLIANRWNVKMPGIIEGSIQIMSKAGSGVAMFCMGLTMALQEKMIDCGIKLTIFGMLLRFVASPTTMAVGSLAVGLKGDALHIAIIQAALPQALISFVYAKEYGLHVSVLSTAVIFGTIVSIPVLISYYAILNSIHGRL